MGGDFPENWGMAPLGSLIEFSLGGDWGKDPDFQDENYVEVRCIRSSEIKNWNTEKGLSAAKRKIKKSSLEKRRLREGDIIVEVSGGGPDQPVGRTVLIDNAALSNDPETPKICTNFFRLIRPVEGIYPKFLDFFLKFFYKTGKVKGFQGGSNNLRNLKFKDYLGLEVPVPPKGEQHRIVAKIEELFSELDDSVANLETARARLQAYRQSLLKNAFEGRLTEQWRRDHADELESADQLLERIREERQARYQQQLEDWKAQVAQWEADGKSSKKPQKPVAIKPQNLFSLEDVSRFPQLPKEWNWVRVGDLLRVPPHNGRSVKDRADGFPVLRLTAIKDGRINLQEFKLGDWTKSEASGYLVDYGDFLVMRGNGSKRLVGSGGGVDTRPEPVAFPDTMIRLRLDLSGVDPDFFGMVWNSRIIRDQVETVARTTAGIYKINQQHVQEFMFPLPPLEEQKVITKVLEGKHEAVEPIEETVGTSLQKDQSLRQSILKRAFEGRLVSQDPNDEPASELLARIQGAEQNVQVRGEGRRPRTGSASKEAG